jgi:hypothetical protein
MLCLICWEIRIVLETCDEKYKMILEKPERLRLSRTPVSRSCQRVGGKKYS